MFRWLFDRFWARRKIKGLGDTQLEGTKFTVRQGRRYHATIILSWLEQFASNETIADKLTELGFKEVKVTGSGDTRHAEALWAGPDTTAPLDSHLRDVSELA